VAKLTGPLETPLRSFDLGLQTAAGDPLLPLPRWRSGGSRPR